MLDLGPREHALAAAAAEEEQRHAAFVHAWNDAVGAAAAPRSLEDFCRDAIEACG